MEAERETLCLSSFHMRAQSTTSHPLPGPGMWSALAQQLCSLALITLWALYCNILLPTHDLEETLHLTHLNHFCISSSLNKCKCLPGMLNQITVESGNWMCRCGVILSWSLLTTSLSTSVSHNKFCLGFSVLWCAFFSPTYISFPSSSPGLFSVCFARLAFHSDFYYICSAVDGSLLLHCHSWTRWLDLLFSYCLCHLNQNLLICTKCKTGSKLVCKILQTVKLRS